MPKVVRDIKDPVKAKSVAEIYANSDFGKGGHDMVLKERRGAGINVVADLSTDVSPVDFSSVVIKAKPSGADALFVYGHEEESARILKALRKQGYDKPVIGETTLANDKVIELAGDAANGVVAQVGLTPDAPNPPVQAFARRYLAEYKVKADQNAMTGHNAGSTGPRC